MTFSEASPRLPDSNPFWRKFAEAGHFVYEYSVVARNYGISALLLFVIAANYQAWRTRGYLIGGLFFLLANTNVIAAIMNGAFILFWFLDLLQERARPTFSSTR